MNQIKTRKNEILELLKRENDFYLITLLENMGRGYSAGELFENQLKYIKKNEEIAIFELVLESKIPLINSKIVYSAQIELNRLIQRKAEFVNLKRDDLAKETDKTIKYLEVFLRKYECECGKTKNFSKSRTSFRNAICEDIYRSIEKIELLDVALAEELRKSLKKAPNIHIISDNQ
ncbi:MAG TPA: hypothetical protein PL063_03500 [Candidatus Cloacimonadota bacterium]|nr:hypothetical protein [Candidatus Cloacimonadales bacterium]HPY96258.1 hypothetical protein [Candidatus Cloacimonadota bacterium]HQB40847.1 hypothetical protein [Candidatus Cloacimonadota bacterium]